MKLSRKGSPSFIRAVCTVRERQWLLVSYSRGAWLSDMANISELSLTHRKVISKLKITDKLEPKGTQSDNLEPCEVTRIIDCRCIGGA